jgi:UDPglucose 6-dehydrogenase
VEATVEVNAAQKARMVKKIRDALGGSEAGKIIAILGLTFKPKTDDMRDSPSLTIIPNLVDKGARIRAHDPQGAEEAKQMLPPNIEYFEEVYTTVSGVDAVIILTEWNEYRGLDLDKLKEYMRGNVFVDLRNIYEPETIRGKGFSYTCIGRD